MDVVPMSCWLASTSLLIASQHGRDVLKLWRSDEGLLERSVLSALWHTQMAQG